MTVAIAAKKGVPNILGFLKSTEVGGRERGKRTRKSMGAEK